MREGSLDAPIRHPIDWQDPDYTTPEKIYAELERVFDICHGCRRCFNLCDSFPRLFDLIDESETMELDSVDKADYKSVVDACTLCDMCFMTKCPYVPPHEFDLDFPHLMLRYRAMEHAQGKTKFVENQLAKTDRNGTLARPVAGLANWATKTSNGFTRSMMQSMTGIDREAALPQFKGQTLELLDKALPLTINTNAPAYGRKAVLYATCYGNYNKTDIGLATRAVLAKNGVESVVIHPTCCGMPKLERGDIAAVADSAQKVADTFAPYIADGYDIIAMVPSCALMVKFEWPLILPNNESVKQLANATFDLSEYIVDIAKKEGLADGLQPLDGGVSMHLSCHARAQNMGAKSVEMLNLIPDANVTPIERCSGHGGSWGIMKDNFQTALKVGKPVARAALKNGHPHVASECPLAADHIVQGMEILDKDAAPAEAAHPIELLAQAYGLTTDT